MTRLIDADAQKRTYTQNCNYENCIYDGAFIVNNIDKQPTVDAEPVRHGKWIVTNEGVVKCSECKRKFILLKENYCPNCGARMDKE